MNIPKSYFEVYRESGDFFILVSFPNIMEIFTEMSDENSKYIPVRFIYKGREEISKVLIRKTSFKDLLKSYKEWSDYNNAVSKHVISRITEEMEEVLYD